MRALLYRRARPAWRAAAVALCVMLCVPAGVRAGDPADEASERRDALKLAGEAMDLFAAGDFEAALDKFSRADELVPAPTLKLRIARCLDKLDRMLEAADKYREVIAFELSKSSPAQHHEARKEAVPELAKLLEQVPSVVVVVEGPGSGNASVLLEGSPLPREALGHQQPVDPGNYSFEARASDRQVRKVVQVKRGARMRVVLTLPAQQHDAAKPDDGARRTMHIIGWTAVGLGGAALSLGSIAGVVVLTEEEDLLARCPDRQCPPSEHDDARAFDTLRFLSTGALIAGGVLTAAGVATLLLAPSNENVAIWFSPSGMGIGGRF